MQDQDTSANIIINLEEEIRKNETLICILIDRIHELEEELGNIKTDAYGSSGAV